MTLLHVEPARGRAAESACSDVGVDARGGACPSPPVTHLHASHGCRNARCRRTRDWARRGSDGRCRRLLLLLVLEDLRLGEAQAAERCCGRLRC